MEPHRSPARRAARAVWILGTLETVFFSSCAALLGIGGLISLETYEQAVSPPQTLPPEFLQVHGLLPAMAGLLALVGLVPGLCFLWLGFGVRGGRPGAIRAALFLAFIQSIALGLFSVERLINAAATGDPVALSVTVILLGTPLALLGFTIRQLLGALS